MERGVLSLRIEIQFVAADGTYLMANGMRVRCAPGNGEGSLSDEMVRGVRTPFDAEPSRKICLELVTGREVGFVRSLPSVKLVPKDPNAIV